MSSQRNTRSKCIFDLMDGPDISVPYWINPLIPRNSKVILGSYAKAGKTAVMLSIIRALVTGENLFECPRFTTSETANVLIFEQELGEAGFQRRTRKVLQGVQRRNWIRYISRDPDVSFSDAKGLELIGNEVAECKPNILILDPIGAMYHDNENEAHEVARLWREIDRLLVLGKQQNMTVILSHHFGKRPNGKAAENFDFLDPYNCRGSGKWFDVPDTLITMNRLGELPGRRDSWRVQMRFTVRHDEPQEEIYCTINRERDLRVRYERDVEPPTMQLTTPLRTTSRPASTDPRSR